MSFSGCELTTYCRPDHKNLKFRKKNITEKGRILTFTSCLQQIILGVYTLDNDIFLLKIKMQMFGWYYSSAHFKMSLNSYL